MKQAVVLVEGRTEELFVQRLLVPHFLERGLYTRPINLNGVSNWSKIEKQLRILAHQPHWALITTMIDFYGLPADTPGHDSKPDGGAAAVRHIEVEIARDICDPRLLPYLSLHEFEALLFADPELIADHAGQRRIASQLGNVAAAFSGPEKINDQPNTAPSKRIKAAWRAYEKANDGIEIAMAIGLARMRGVCPHFSGWIDEIETRSATVIDG